jgi:hypothetical protein
MMADPITTLEHMLDSDKWPTYRSKQHSTLETLAKEAYARNTYDGYLSHVLITSQMCEDYARITLKNAQFTLQICLAIQGFGWNFPKSQLTPALDKAMFGQLLQMLEHSVDFDQKKEFIEACEKLSRVRNKLVHELDQGVGLAEIKKYAEECAVLHTEIIDAFNSADEHFSYFFLEIVRDPAWDTMLRVRRHAATGNDIGRIDAIAGQLDQARKTSPLHPRTN